MQLILSKTKGCMKCNSYPVELNLLCKISIELNLLFYIFVVLAEDAIKAALSDYSIKQKQKMKESKDTGSNKT